MDVDISEYLGFEIKNPNFKEGNTFILKITKNYIIKLTINIFTKNFTFNFLIFFYFCKHLRFYAFLVIFILKIFPKIL